MPPDDRPPEAVGAGPAALGERDRGHLVLLLITVLLVVAGVVLLILGYVDSSMTILYASIGCAALAGVILVVVGRLNRRRAVAMAGGGAGPGPRGPVAAGADGADDPAWVAGHLDATGAADATGPAATADPAGTPSTTDAAGAAGAAESAGVAGAGEPGPTDPVRSQPATTRPEPGPAGDWPGETPTPG